MALEVFVGRMLRSRGADAGLGELKALAERVAHAGSPSKVWDVLQMAAPPPPTTSSRVTCDELFRPRGSGTRLCASRALRLGAHAEGARGADERAEAAARLTAAFARRRMAVVGE